MRPYRAVDAGRGPGERTGQRPVDRQSPQRACRATWLSNKEPESLKGGKVVDQPGVLDSGVL